MLERYAFWLTENSTEGDVMGESRGIEDLELKKEYRAIWQDGTMQKPDPSLFQTRLTSKEIKIKPKSSNIPGLQIADLLAYPLREKLLFDKGIRNNYTGNFNETVYKSVADKIRKNPMGRLRVLVRFSSLKKKGWVLPQPQQQKPLTSNCLD